MKDILEILTPLDCLEMPRRKREKWYCTHVCTGNGDMCQHHPLGVPLMSFDVDVALL